MTPDSPTFLRDDPSVTHEDTDGTRCFVIGSLFLFALLRNGWFVFASGVTGSASVALRYVLCHKGDLATPASHYLELFNNDRLLR